MLRLICVLFFCLASVAYAVEDPNDTYLHRSSCPAIGSSNSTDTSSNFYKCQCTSYVAHKLNEKWGNTNPRFTNQYYGFTQWSDAWKWLDRARSSQAEIGVTGARDNFVWDVPSYNAVFVGDVAYWNKKNGYPYGHVAYVEAVGQDVYEKGVAWVEISEYNYLNPPGYEYTRRTLYKSDPKFPDYFLHIDQDRIFCLANPTVGSCPTLIAGQKVADGPGMKVGGIGGGSDTFNLKINNFWIEDAFGSTLIPGVTTIRPGQVITVKSQVKAKDGDTANHMRPGKSRIEVDLYVRQNTGEWSFLKRDYIQAVNLPNGGTHTESASYTVPNILGQEVSFKAKIDAEDEAYEANEGDNWTEIKTFRVDDFSWLVPIINLILAD